MRQDLFVVNRDICVYPSYLINKFSNKQTEFLMLLNALIQKKEGVLYNDKIYIVKSAKEWGDLLFVCERTINRITKKLLTENVIEILRTEGIRCNQPNHMTILYDNL